MLCGEGERRRDWFCVAAAPPSAPAPEAGAGFRAVPVPRASRGFALPAAGGGSPGPAGGGLTWRTPQFASSLVAAGLELPSVRLLLTACPALNLGHRQKARPRGLFCTMPKFRKPGVSRRGLGYAREVWELPPRALGGGFPNGAVR